MHCSDLDTTDHLALGYITGQRKHTADLSSPNWMLLGITRSEVSKLVDRLTEDGMVQLSSLSVTATTLCNCSYRRLARQMLRDARRQDADDYRGSERSHSVEVESSEPIDPDEGNARSGGPSSNIPVGDMDETAVDSLLSEGDAQSLAGQQIRGRRVATEVVARSRRRNTTLAWQDCEPEQWNASHLAGYFSHATLVLQGVTADRYHQSALLKHYAVLLREGISSSDCKKMTDLFVQQTLALNGTRVESLWKSFIASRGSLYVRLTTNSGQRYNNQPTTDEGDGDDDARWL